MLEHFGLLDGPGLLPQEVATGTDGRIPAGRRRDRGDRGGGPSGGRVAGLIEDDRATRASWGNVSRLTTRGSRRGASSVASSRHGTVRYGD